MNLATIIILVVVAIIVIYFIALYNKFVRLRTRSEEAWADIDVQLKRRYDLIPNLINTVKGYAAHEASVFDNVTKARAAAIGAGTVGEHAEAENMLTGALRSVFAVAEAYPDLKANQNFMELQRELSDTENKIQAARRFFNSVVRDLNIAVETFPSSIVASMFNFGKKEYFDLEENSVEREPVAVNF